MWISGLYGAGKLLSEPQYNLESSKETRVYLATRPNQFKYVLAPTHGSWLNFGDLLGKMTRIFLRQIRVGPRQELKRTSQAGKVPQPGFVVGL